MNLLRRVEQMANKDPAFLFYPADFLVGTMQMTYDQIGKYIKILCLMHSRGGYLKDKDIKKILDFENEDDIDVLDKFKLSEQGYFNNRLLQEIDKRIAFRDKQSLNAKEGWKKRKKGSMPNHKSGKAKPMPLENEDINTNINEIIEYWNNNSNLSKVIKLTDMRKKHIKARIDDFDVDTIYKMIGKVKESDFLQGKTADWKASFDWCFNASNFIKILEDNYANVKNNSKLSEQDKKKRELEELAKRY